MTRKIAIRFVVLMLAAFVLASPAALTAQMGGRGGGRGGSGGQSTMPGSGDNAAADDFHRAVALQATDDQRAQFQTVGKNTATARKLALQLVEDLRQSVGKPAASPNQQAQAAALKTAIDNATNATHVFLESFDKEQTSGLKDPIKKLNKAGENVESKWKALTRELEKPQANGNDPKLSGAADELVRALDEYASRQAALGTQMGIQ